MNQPTALRLADSLDKFSNPWDKEAADELRRLYAVNADLLQALKNATEAIEHWGLYATDYFQKKWDLQGDIAAACAAIDRAEGQA